MTRQPPHADIETELEEAQGAPGSMPPPAGRVYLIVRVGDRVDIVDVQEGADVTVGRGGDATVVVDHARVSRLHARARRSAGGLLLQDLGSRNGTKVNGVALRASERAVVGGDVIQIGPAEIVVAATLGTVRVGAAPAGGRIERELASLADQPGAAATLLRIAVEGAASLGSMLEGLGDIGVIEERGDGEYLVVLTTTDRESAARVMAGLREADPAATVTTVRYPEDGTSVAALIARARQMACDPEVELPATAEGVVVADGAMVKVFQVARRVAAAPTTVLLLGETGVGKEIVAEQIHRWSTRAAGPFVRLNCASLPEALLESELFGHEQGAFTGANRRKSGYLEVAAGGTLLLDEIGELPLAMQAKLLRALETRRVVPLGGTREVAVDVRFLCATHRDLQVEVQQGRFREDLYYRIGAFPLKIPPLRERPAEIALLADRFAGEFAARMRVPVPVIDRNALRLLYEHGWPGNVRELRNVIEHAVVLAGAQPIRAEHLPESVRLSGAVRSARPGAMRENVADVERRSIEEALAATSGNQTHAALRLGISRRALVYKLAKYGIRRG